MSKKPQFVITRQAMEERCIEDSTDVRGPFDSHDEAQRAINAWITECSDDFVQEMNDNLWADPDDYLTIYLIHELYKV